MRNFQRILAGVILVAGLGSSAAIYLTATEKESDPMLAFSSAINPRNSKMYMHDLRVYGGKANVFADEVVRWFDGLWQGRELAFTVAYITVFVSAALFFLGGRSSAGLKSDVRDDKSQAGPNE